VLPRGYLRNLDYGLLLSAALLTLTGLLMLYSLGVEHQGGGGKVFFYYQLAWLAPALFVGFLCWILNYKLWDRFSWLLYIINILLLIALVIIGKKISGAASWLSVGFARIQPSEFAKIFFVLTFAGYLSRNRQELNRLLFLSLALLQFIIPFGLIMLQPDLGTALVFLAVFFGMLYVAGVDWLALFAIAVVFASGGVAAAPFVMKGYQFQRLTSFLRPENDPRGTGYQLIQSKIAIGSGGLFGKGIFKGTQSALGFLPTAHSDFIFSVVCEQAGFVGGVIVILLFMWFLMRVMRIGGQAEELFAVYIAAGIFTMIAFQAMVNIGMTVGLFPITGVPLPFVSYGGSSLMINAVAVGLLMNISVRRRKIMFV
jgi:rod shape determining protein RodA